jgi:hypothetical protein
MEPEKVDLIEAESRIAWKGNRMKEKERGWLWIQGYSTIGEITSNFQ